MSTAQLVLPVHRLAGRSVRFIEDCQGPEAERAIATMLPGNIGILENTRFHAGEEKNDPELAKAMAALGDYYVNDAFSAAHRAHASTEGIAHFLPSYAGRAMEAELKALERALGNPERPVAAVVGGAKVSTKLAVLGHLVGKVDHLIIGGGMANTFLAARGVDVGKSLSEHDLTGEANAIFERADEAGCTIHLPYDVVVAKEFAANPPSMRTCNVHEVQADEMILDVGPAAVEALADVLKTCRTLVWNGPLGAFETPPFDAATVALAQTAAALTKEGGLVSVAGGGDTVAALNHAGVAQDFSFVSTAGGAFLEWMEGRTLPGVAALETTRGVKMAQNAEMLAKVKKANGFIAALDQSGGSTPGALKGYGYKGDEWSSEEEMYGLIHKMRTRIISSPEFTGDKILGAILFERTMDGEANGKPVPEYLWSKGVVPFLKIDKGLADEAEGVKLMKPMPDLDALLERAVEKGIFGTKERSVIDLANPAGIAQVVGQQFEVAKQIAAARPRSDHRAGSEHQEPGAGAADEILRDEILRHLDRLPEGHEVMLKLSIPAKPGLFQPLIDHPRVLRVVALSGGFSRSDACRELAKNPGMIASFSRALLEDLRQDMSDEEFDRSLKSAIDEIYEASTEKVAA